MANVSDVIGFEVKRALRKKTFWYTSLVPPLIVLAIMAISVVSSKSADQASQQQTQALEKNTKVAVYDQTGLLSTPSIAKQVTIEPSQAAGIAAVRAGAVDAFLFYPRNVVKESISVYGQDKGLTATPPYDTIAQALLKAGTLARVSTSIHNVQVVQLLGSQPSAHDMLYKNGVVSNGLAAVVVPGLFLLGLLTLVVLLSYIMLTSVTEEKENRAAEMLLTAIKPRNLITGKIFSIFVLGGVQLLVIIVPILAALLVFRNQLSLPYGISLTQLPLDPQTIAIGAAFMLSGLVMFTGFMVGLSALFPSAQEAGRYLGVAIIWAFIPIYTLRYIITSPNAPIVSVFTYFPLTAPTTVLLRNALGSIPLSEALGALAIVVASAVLGILLAVRAFRYGAMEYGRRISIKELFD